MELAYPLAAVCRLVAAPRSTVYHHRSRDSEVGRPGPAPSTATTPCSSSSAWGWPSRPSAGGRPQGPGPPAPRPSGPRGRQTSAAPDAPRRAAGPPSGPAAGARPVATTAPSSPLVPTSAGMPTPPRPGPVTTAVWVFVCVDHFSAEAWARVAKIGDGHAPSSGLAPDIARGVAVRQDWGSQYRSVHFQGSLR
jgi:hypothetical protein